MKHLRKCGIDMNRYFVKTHFSGWCEVTEVNFGKFVENIHKHATGIKADEKEEYIKKVTRIEEGRLILPSQVKSCT